MSTSRLERISLELDDVSQARDWLVEAYGAQAVGDPDESIPGRLRVDQVRTPQVELAQVAVPPTVRSRVDGQGWYVFLAQHAGEMELQRTRDSRRYQAGDVYLSVRPDDTFWSLTRHTDVDTVSLPRVFLDHAAAMAAASPIPRWDFTTEPANEAGARQWRRLTAFVRDLLDDDIDTVGFLVLQQAARLMAVTALQTFPNSALGEAEPPPASDAHPGTLRRAIDYIDSHPDDDVTLTAIADAARVSPRAVQMAFRRHLDTTPTAYLRQTRLQAAREQLLDATPGDHTTVTDVAYRWGFSGPSRFARIYREAFGELPSQTLRR